MNEREDYSVKKKLQPDIPLTCYQIDLRSLAFSSSKPWPPNTMTPDEISEEKELHERAEALDAHEAELPPASRQKRQNRTHHHPFLRSACKSLHNIT